MDGTAAAGSAITAREHEVWSLVAAHLTNREVAERLCLSVRTVESHVAALIRKLQVADRRELARAAAEERERAVELRWPTPVTSFVGREAESAELTAAISVHRMVTATGPGGVGKTRLALRAAQTVAAARHEGGWFVDLVHVSDPELVVPALADAVGVVAPLGGSIEEAVTRSLADSDALVVLDNCEHLLDAVRSCVELLLGHCPSLTVVATSRVRMGAPFEWVYPVPGLSVDAAAADGTDDGDAVALFVERARSAGALHPLDRGRVAQLCRSLDGMALAIELAAARCPTLGLDGLLEGLDRHLGLLTANTGIDDRHRSLRATMAWSHQLLSEGDQVLLAVISVFGSWFDVDAAVTVASPSGPRSEVTDQLARLADHSLLLAAPGTPTRYRALETIRQFGAERLEDLGYADAVHARHRAWCHNRLADLAGQPRDEAWCERLDRVAPDVRAAIAVAAARGRDEAAAGLAESLAEPLLLRGRPEECQRSYEQAARHAPTLADRARLLSLAAGAAASRLVGNETLLRLDAAAASAVEAGDPASAAEDLAWMAIFNRWAPGIIAELPDPGTDDRWLARARALAGGRPVADATVALAISLGLADDDPQLPALATSVIVRAREAGRPLMESVALDVLCGFYLARGELTEALRQIARRGDVLDGVDLDAVTAYHFNDFLLMGSEVCLAVGDLPSAAEYADRLSALACYRDYPHPALARRLKVDAMAGDLEAAVTRGEEFLAAWERAGCPVSGTLNITAYIMTMVHGLLGNDVNREQWIGITRALTVDPRRLATWEAGWAPAFATFDALVHLERQDPESAVARLSADVDDHDVWHTWVGGMWRPWYAALWTEAAVLARRSDAEARLARGVEATRENPIAAAIVARAADLARGDRDLLPRHADSFARLGCRYQERRTHDLAAGEECR
ncbi:MAG: ATP-binding protein [Nocardioidaceae bacterium]